MKSYLTKWLKSVNPFNHKKKSVERVKAELLHFSDQKIEKEILPLLSQLETEESKEIIQLLEGTGFIDKQVDLLLTGKKDRKLQAINILGLLGSEKGTEAMIKALKDSNEEVKWALTENLKKVQDPELIPKLLRNLEAPNQWLPARIADICLSFGEKSISPLLEELERDKRETKLFALETLGELANKGFKSPEVKGYILKSLEDNETKIRLAAIQALAYYSEPSDGVLLLDYLLDPDWVVRVKVGQALKQLEWKITREQQKLISDKKTSSDSLERLVIELKKYNQAS